MTSLSDRFKRLPEEQILRNEESTRQAREASELLQRLRATRQEAEQLAKEEIERTRRIQREEIEMHPEVIDLKRRLRNAERGKEAWERKRNETERSYQVELNALKREEENLTNRFNQAQNEELQYRTEQEKLLQERQVKEDRFRHLEQQLNTLQREEEPQFMNDMAVLRQQITDLEGKLPSDDIKKASRDVEEEIRRLQESKEKNETILRDLKEKEGKAGEDLLKAQQMVSDAKRIEESKQAELESLEKSVGSLENPNQIYVEAERKVFELKGSQERLFRELETKQENRRFRDKKIQDLRAEIERLRAELTHLEESDWHDLQSIEDLEHELKRFDIELGDARERAEYAKSKLEAYNRDRQGFEEVRGRLEREIQEVRRARFEAESEETRATDLCTEIVKKCNETESHVKVQAEQIEKLNRKFLDLGAKLFDQETINKTIQEKRATLANVQNQWKEWCHTRRGPLQEEFESLRAWLASHQRIDTTPKTFRSTAIWNDLARIRDRIKDLQTRNPTIPIDFEDPEGLRPLISAKEREIYDRLNRHNGPASQRFLNQLERETEAMMRAQIAATHESKQEAIERDAHELSKLRVSLHPHMAFDEEARTRLWRLNQETGETGTIADQVLSLCQSNNITIKQEK